MSQTTAKTVEDVLRWIEATPHHFGSWDEEPGYFILKGHGHKLRIPEPVQVLTRGLVVAGGRFDNRMFRANAAGKRRLRRHSPSPARADVSANNGASDGGA